MTRISIVLALVTILGSAACKKKEDSAGGPASGKTAEKSASAATKLPKLGLQIDASGEVEVGDAIVGNGHMLQGGSFGALSVTLADKPKTLDEAKSDADMYSPKNVKGDKLPDGWWLTFDNTGSAGANYFVQVRRDIDGKTYDCSTTVGNADQSAAALAACKTLRK